MRKKKKLKGGMTILNACNSALTSEEGEEQLLNSGGIPQTLKQGLFEIREEQRTFHFLVFTYI